MNEARAQSARDVQIRGADACEAPQITACLEAAFAPYRELYSPAAYADTVPDVGGMVRRICSMHVLVAVVGDRVVGTIAGAFDEQGDGHLRGMAVLPQWQGLGVASQLLVAIEVYLWAQGCSQITLDTTLPLQRAIRFYESHGYRHSGVTNDFFGMPLYEYAKERRGLAG
jgi:GNAT superfamily N-acetyltransferase